MEDVVEPSRRAQDGWSHPRPAAPGALATVQMFVNSDDLEEGSDEFTTVDGMTRWLRAAGLLGARGQATERDRRAAIELRTALRTLLRANHDGPSGHERDAGKVLERIGRAAALEP